MKKFFFAVLFAASTGHTQTSTGFGSPDSLDALRNYRLPAWRYTTIVINASGNGYGLSMEQNRDIDAKRSDYHFLMGSIITGYYESEKNIRNYDLDFSSRYSYRTDQSDKKRKDYHANMDFRGNWKNYFRDDKFWAIDLSGETFYGESEYKSALDKIQSSEKSGDFHLSLGLGMGRVRNVSPVVRALRLQERYRVLTDNKNAHLSQSEIQTIAQEIANTRGTCSCMTGMKSISGPVCIKTQG